MVVIGLHAIVEARICQRFLHGEGLWKTLGYINQHKVPIGKKGRLSFQQLLRGGSRRPAMAKHALNLPILAASPTIW